MKRKLSKIEDIVPNKKIKSLWDVLNKYEKYNDITEKDEWVSATAIRNYMLNDPLIDWLDRYYDHYEINKVSQGKTNKIEVTKGSDNKMNVLFSNGLKFEQAVFDELKKKYPEDCVQVSHNNYGLTEGNYQKTITYMEEGKPIILQAVLINRENKTRGIADIVIRSDYINKLFGELQITSEKENIPAPKLNKTYHYRVIDVKWTTLHLCSNGKLIRNNDRIPAYKGQLAIYNCILGHIQGYYPNQTYILGHSYAYETCGDKFTGSSCFDLLGHIDYEDFDKPFIAQTAEAIKWIRKLRYEGFKWKIIPPSISELYPNMSNNNDAPWTEVKKNISTKICELTQLWQVGVKNRVIGHSNKIYKWTDKRCNAFRLGITGKKIAPILDKIIKTNRSKTILIDPKVIKNNDMNWQIKHELDFYVDFETINDCFRNKSMDIYEDKLNTNIIFMIGCGYIDNNEWQYKCFKMNKLDLDNERDIIDEWFQFIKSRIDIYKKDNIKVRFIHWSNAEITSLNIANKRHYLRWQEYLNNILWIDLCKIFQDEPITIKGVLRFKLKDIAKAMHNYGMINTTWDLDITDGLSAMIDAITYYENLDNDKDNITTINNIQKYNEVDCKVIWEIITYLRNNQCKLYKKNEKN